MTQVKAKFTRQEDIRLSMAVQKHHSADWKAIALEMQGRSARQCRERWTNYLNPVFVQARWTEPEDALLDEKFAELGAKWKAIAQFFPNRSENSIKSHWFVRKRRFPRSAPVVNLDAVDGDQPMKGSPSIEQNVRPLASTGITTFDELFSEPAKNDPIWQDIETWFA
jgi:hypothetical protein